MKQELKFCINCKFKSNLYECSHPKNVKLDLVTGEESLLWGIDAVRSTKAFCGPQGKWFEPKPSEPPIFPPNQLLAEGEIPGDKNRSWWKRFFRV